MSLTRLQLFVLLLLAQVSFGAQHDCFKNPPERTQRSSAATQCRFWRSVVASRPGALVSVVSVRSGVNLFFARYEVSAFYEPLENAAPTAPLDLRGYIAELERWSELAGRLADHPEQAGVLRRQLPDSWLVVVQKQRFSVSTRSLGEALDRVVRDPATATRSAQDISGQIDTLLDDARATYRTSKRDYSPERAWLDQILKRSEYRFVREGASSETFWDQLLDRLYHWVSGILDRTGNHPKVTNFLRWGIVILLGLVLLAWLVHSLTQVSSQRPSASTGGARAAPPRDWVEEARSAAARGEFREAIRLVYGAALLALGEAGAWQVDRSRTHREYLRLLPADSARRPHLVALTDCFERVWYGRAQASGGDYEAALAELESLR